VAGPLVVIALLLRVANRRVNDELAEQAASPVEPAEHPGE
jgi:hypothetical protein